MIKKYTDRDRMDRDRIIEHFKELVEIDSESFHERKMADRLTEELEALGFEVSEDDAGKAMGSEAGNLYAVLQGNDANDANDANNAGSARQPILFAAHMDTVVPGIGKKALVDYDKGVITSAGDTVLGSDDLSGVVQILEGVKYVLEEGIPHGDIEVVFTAAEEAYCSGVKHFDFGRIKAPYGFVMDLSGSVGTAATAAPSIISFGFEITGKPAHSGFDPEAGINAIEVASKVIAGTKQGLVADGLTFNIGTISGGSQTNIVSEKCRCTGEVRGFDHEAAVRVLEELESRISEKCKAAGASYSFDSEVKIRAYRTPETAEVCEVFAEVCRGMGLEPEFCETRGGSDNNVFAAKGLSGIVVGCGMSNTHATNEFIRIDDLVRGAEMVVALIQQM